ncbi:hypothetical protein TSUD_289710 [Trifolium subterraneum]|uniref:Uncharacterized protein n=1 Tax=Trifolium subterraneum TaxID=3900 RepID=A0A2Z6M1E9_TRISU|nr:hypothetical protein TSUD_289710 [Trifolium subterraneum]
MGMREQQSVKITAATARNGEATVTTKIVTEETEADRENKMKIKGSEEATTTVEDPNLFKEEEISQTKEDRVIVLDPEPPPEPPDDGSRVVSIQQSETLGGESLRTASGFSMPKSPWNQTTKGQALLKEEVRSQKMQVVWLSVTVTPPSKPPDNGQLVVSLQQSLIHVDESSTATKLVDEEKKVLEEGRAKWTIWELNISSQIITRVVIRGAHIPPSLSCVTQWTHLTT